MQWVQATPRSHPELRSMLAASLMAVRGEIVTPDPDGLLLVQVGGFPCWIQPAQSLPFLRLDVIALVEVEDTQSRRSPIRGGKAR